MSHRRVVDNLESRCETFLAGYGMVWYGIIWYGIIWYDMVYTRN